MSASTKNYILHNANILYTEGIKIGVQECIHRYNSDYSSFLQKLGDLSSYILPIYFLYSNHKHELKGQSTRENDST
jgi:hypothetical protein